MTMATSRILLGLKCRSVAALIPPPVTSTLSCVITSSHVTSPRLHHPLHHPSLVHVAKLSTKPKAALLLNNDGPSPLLQPQSLTWCVLRHKSKKKGEKKGKNKGGGGITLSADELDGVLDVEAYQRDMDRIVAALQDKFIHTLSVRTSQGVFDNLPVKTDDGTFSLIQIAQVIQKSPQMIIIDATLSPMYLKDVKEALVNSGLNINPQQEGTTFYVQIPQVTKEHRQKLAKNAKTLCEASKKDMRNIFSKYSKKINSSKDWQSEDIVKGAATMAKEMMDGTVAKMEDMTSAKQKELTQGK